MAENGFYRTWKAHINAIPSLKRFQQVGIGVSYPLLAYTDDGLLVRHFYHAADLIGPDTVLIGPPRVLVAMDYETSEIVDTDFEAFNLPLFEDVEYTLSAEERAARQPDVERLQALYDAMLASYPEPPESELMTEFVATLRRVVPPVLWPYYETSLGNLTHVSQ